MGILRDEKVLISASHDGNSDYSSWILPTAHAILRESGFKIADLDVLSAASGPGSFTGVRVGLTSIKAWSEAYSKPIVAVSRLEAMCAEVSTGEGEENGFIAAYFDAKRGQVFGGLYGREQEGLELVEQEMVIAPEGFLRWVDERTTEKAVFWVSLDPEIIGGLESWRNGSVPRPKIQKSPRILAPTIGRLAYQRAMQNRMTDALALDAEYVRRSDAEMFWKGKAQRGGS